MNLEHCPGCGGEASLNDDRVGGVRTFFVSCKSRVPGGTCWMGPNAQSMDEARMLWNRVALLAAQKETEKA